MQPKLSHPVPDKVLALLGDYIVRYSILVAHLQWLLGFYVEGEQNVLQIAANELSDRKLRDVLEKAHRHRFGEDEWFSDLKLLLKRAEREASERNRLVHATWAASATEHSATRIRVDRKSGLRVAFEQLGSDELRTHIDRLNKLIVDLENLAINRALTESSD